MIVTWLIVLGEIALLLAVVLAVLSVKSWRRVQREKAAIDALVEDIKTDQTERRDKLAALVKDSHGCEDAEALSKAEELVKKQNRFYQGAIDLYHNRDHALLSKLHRRMEEVIEQYRELVRHGGGGPEAAVSIERVSAQLVTLNGEVEGLRAENAGLRQRLQLAEKELEQLGREYVAAFNKIRAEAKAAAQASATAHTAGEGGASETAYARAMNDAEQEGESDTEKSSSDANVFLADTRAQSM